MHFAKLLFACEVQSHHIARPDRTHESKSLDSPETTRYWRAHTTAEIETDQRARCLRHHLDQDYTRNNRLVREVPREEVLVLANFSFNDYMAGFVVEDAVYEEERRPVGD